MKKEAPWFSYSSSKTVKWETSKIRDAMTENDLKEKKMMNRIRKKHIYDIFAAVKSFQNLLFLLSKWQNIGMERANGINLFGVIFW